MGIVRDSDDSCNNADESYLLHSIVHGRWCMKTLCGVVA